MIEVVNTCNNEKHLIKNKSLLKIKMKVQEKYQDFFKNGPDLKRIIREYNKEQAKNGTPLFNAIEIETVNRCNGVCPFCPVNKNSDSRTYHKMEKELFIKIISELKQLNYTGNVALYSNNEPFLDERIVEFAKYARETLPLANIYLFTNGTLLTLEKYQAIMPYLDYMHIDNYSDTFTLIKPVREIFEQSKNNTELEKAVIYLRKQNEVLTSRGGQAPNKKMNRGLNIPCLLPYQQFIIRPDGKVSLCCNDALGKYTMGDISTQSIKEVWEGEKFQEIRKKIYKGRKGIELCRGCDTRIGRREFIKGKWQYIIGRNK